MPANFDRIFGQPSPTFGPAVTPAEEEQSTLGTALDWMSRPSAAIAAGLGGAMRGELDAGQAAFNQLTGADPQTNWKQQLTKLGAPEDSMLASAAGFVGDVVLDPLNLIPAGWVAKGLKSGAKATGLAKVAEKVGATEVGQALGKRFIPHFDAPTSLPNTGVGPTYREQKSLLQMRQQGASTAAADEVTALLGKLTPQDRRAIPFIIEGRPAQNQAQLDAADAIRGWLGQRAQRETAAGTLDPTNVLQNYISYVLPKGKGDVAKEAWFRGVSGKSRFSQQRTLKSWDDALNAGAIEDPLQALAIRARVGEKAATTADWSGEIADKFGSATKLAADWKKVTIPGVVKTSPLGVKLASTYFAPEVADDLARVLKMTTEPSDAISKGMGKMMATWKTMATTLNPGFHPRNFLSNGWLMMAGGLTTKEATEALVRGTTSAAAKAPKAGVTPQTYALAQKFGILTNMGQFDEVADLAPGAMQKLAKMTGAQRVGNAVEDGARLGMFDALLRRGMKAEDAALKVRDYLFNYQELTDFEKKLRRNVIPFYTWMRKAAPVVAESFINNPSLWNKTESVTTLFNNLAKDAGSFQEETPAWAADRIQLPASPGFTRDMGNPFPVTELNRLPGGVIGEGIGDTLSRNMGMISPFIKVPIELAANKQFFSGRQVTPGKPGAGIDTEKTISAYRPSDILLGKVMGAGTKGGKQQVNALSKYLLNQIPIASGSSVLSGIAEPFMTPDTLNEEGDVVMDMAKRTGGVVENILGLTDVKTRDETLNTRKKAAQEKHERKKKAYKKSRLDALAERVGAK